MGVVVRRETDELRDGAVYVREGAQWVERQKLTAPPGSGSVRFGRSIAVSGDACVIGGTVKRGEWETTGIVYVFVREAGRWQLAAKLRAPSGSPTLDFGHAVAISGDRVLVGAPTDIEEIGAAWVFARRESAWEVEQELVAAGRQPDDLYGRAVRLAAEIAVRGTDSLQASDRAGGPALDEERFRFEMDFYLEHYLAGLQGFRGPLDPVRGMLHDLARRAARPHRYAGLLRGLPGFSRGTRRGGPGVARFRGQDHFPEA